MLLFAKATIAKVNIEFIIRCVEIIHLAVVAVLKIIGSEIELTQEVLPEVNTDTGSITVSVYFIGIIVRDILNSIGVRIVEGIDICGSGGVGHIGIS